MTFEDEISGAIEYLERANGNCDTDCIDCKYNNDCWSYKSRKMAIRSLEAWDKVLDELREYGSICVEYTAEDDKVDAVVDSVLKQAKQAVLEIISKHLAEVTQDEQKHDGNNERN